MPALNVKVVLDDQHLQDGKDLVEHRQEIDCDPDIADQILVDEVRILMYSLLPEPQISGGLLDPCP
ncbi:hypothetical protein CKO15_09890 [Halorhodospira abdelmalekii]|nr:hypothetical protein [Halorhodospira abdelmalekii]